MAVNEEREDQTVAGATTKGFAGGFLGTMQDRLRTATGRGQTPNTTWRANNEEVVSLNTGIMAAQAERVALLGQQLQATHGTLAGGSFHRLKSDRTSALEKLKSMQESMAHDQVNVDRRDGAHTEADVQERRLTLSRMQTENDHMRARLPQRGPATTTSTKPADGRPAKTTAAAPVMAGSAPARTSAPEVGRAVSSAVMNPAHIAAIEALTGPADEGMERDSRGMSL